MVVALAENIVCLVKELSSTRTSALLCQRLAVFAAKQGRRYGAFFLCWAARALGFVGFAFAVAGALDRDDAFFVFCLAGLGGGDGVAAGGLGAVFS